MVVVVAVVVGGKGERRGEAEPVEEVEEEVEEGVMEEEVEVKATASIQTPSQSMEQHLFTVQQRSVPCLSWSCFSVLEPTCIERFDRITKRH